MTRNGTINWINEDINANNRSKNEKEGYRTSCGERREEFFGYVDTGPRFVAALRV